MQLKDLVRVDDQNGLVIDGKLLANYQTIEIKPQKLKYYDVTEETTEIIKHNIEWAKTKKGSPKFQFIFLFLPTSCNQKCQGCYMGQDKDRLPPNISGPFFDKTTLDNIIKFAKDHGAKSIIYAGGGELFTWPLAMQMIEYLKEQGLRMVIFTNGTLLTEKMIAHLNELEVSLIFSLRDTVEKYHDQNVQFRGFAHIIKAIDWAIENGMNTDSRLSVEIPVTLNNENRVLTDLLPVLRSLKIVPWIEEFINMSVTEEENQNCHTFDQSREFFKKAAAADAALGINWSPEFGQRIINHPKCSRTQYSFGIYPSGDVFACPIRDKNFGNIYKNSLTEIIYSDKVRQAILNYQYCPCSVFYTKDDQEIPIDLPIFLENKKSA